MEQNHRFSLEKYKGITSRFTCPNCGHKNIFSRYIDNDTGAYLHEKVGRCNREDKCGYHYKPNEFFKDTPTYILSESTGNYIVYPKIRAGC